MAAKKKKSADALLKDLRDQMNTGVYDTLDAAQKMITKNTTKQLVKDGVDLMFKNGGIAIDTYRSVYKLLFPGSKSGK